MGKISSGLTISGQAAGGGGNGLQDAIDAVGAFSQGDASSAADAMAAAQAGAVAVEPGITQQEIADIVVDVATARPGVWNLTEDMGIFQNDVVLPDRFFDLQEAAAAIMRETLPLGSPSIVGTNGNAIPDLETLIWVSAPETYTADEIAVYWGYEPFWKSLEHVGYRKSDQRQGESIQAYQERMRGEINLFLELHRPSASFNAEAAYKDLSFLKYGRLRLPSGEYESLVNTLKSSPAQAIGLMTLEEATSFMLYLNVNSPDAFQAILASSILEDTFGLAFSNDMQNSDDGISYKTSQNLMHPFRIYNIPGHQLERQHPDDIRRIVEKNTIHEIAQWIWQSAYSESFPRSHEYYIDIFFPYIPDTLKDNFRLSALSGDFTDLTNRSQVVEGVLVHTEHNIFSGIYEWLFGDTPSAMTDTISVIQDTNRPIDLKAIRGLPGMQNTQNLRDVLITFAPQVIAGTDSLFLQSMIRDNITQSSDPLTYSFLFGPDSPFRAALKETGMTDQMIDDYAAGIVSDYEPLKRRGGHPSASNMAFAWTTLMWEGGYKLQYGTAAPLTPLVDQIVARTGRDKWDVIREIYNEAAMVYVEQLNEKSHLYHGFRLVYEPAVGGQGGYVIVIAPNGQAYWDDHRGFLFEDAWNWDRFGIEDDPVITVTPPEGEKGLPKPTVQALLVNPAYTKQSFDKLFAEGFPWDFFLTENTFSSAVQRLLGIDPSTLSAAEQSQLRTSLNAYRTIPGDFRVEHETSNTGTDA